MRYYLNLVNDNAHVCFLFENICLGLFLLNVTLPAGCTLQLTDVFGLAPDRPL